MNDAFAGFGVEDNEELDDELSKLENEMVNEEMTEMPSAKGR